ncbi:GMP synthase (glutamine-hydrolysing) [Flavobacteriaceae bacterium MAR_2010_105]|nr:GMP synthase (glutamine-hydrolysing) [Flavobacteriaceae bacterium MAR_2010_105]
MKPNILVLDYSVDRFETPIIKGFLNRHFDFEVTALHITTEASFPKDLIEKDFTHVVHTGSTLSINELAPFTKKAVTYVKDLVDKGTWQFGICYGHQLIALALVGEHAVRATPNGMEAGWGEVKFNQLGQEILSLNPVEHIWQHHFDEVTELPEGSQIIASNTHSQIQAYINYDKRLLGTQFHPEINLRQGNNYFLKDRALLQSIGFDVDMLVQQTPSFDSPKVFFEFFLGS